MSMLDAFFSKGGFFKTAKCKTLLKLTISRVKLLRNRREMQLKQMRKEIAKLLETGQEATARIRVEHIVREENMMAAQEIIELYCELITVRLPIIETQRECPLDLKEAISSICFAAPRCSDLPELQEARMQFAGKYGKEFVTAASELLPDCGVNRQIVELLSVRAPSVDVKMKLLKEIAEEHNLEWDSSFTETEFRKPHEDLLNGPNQFIGGSTLPFPVEKCDDLLTNTSKKASCKEFELEMKPLPDIDFDFLDLPQVPKVSVIPNHIAASAPDLPNIDAKSSSEDAPPLLNGQTSELDHETAKSDSNIAPHHDPSVQSSMLNTPPSIKTPYTPPTFPAVSQETKQFVHPVSPPPLHTKSLTHEPVHFISHPSPPSEDELKIDMDDVLVAARDAAETAEHAAAVACASASLVQSKMSKDERRVGLDDVLVAAQDAAERARIAAAAAHSAASLVQSKMSEFSVKSIGHAFENESEVHVYSSDKTEVLEKQASDQTLFPENSLMIPSPDPPKLEPESPGTLNHQSAHQPSRSPSLEDDPYFAYPNLFGRDSSNFGVDINK